MLNNIKIETFKKEKWWSETHYSFPIKLYYEGAIIPFDIHFTKIFYNQDSPKNELEYISTPNYTIEEKNGDPRKFFIYNMMDYFDKDLKWFKNNEMTTREELKEDINKMWYKILEILNKNKISIIF